MKLLPAPYKVMLCFNASVAPAVLLLEKVRILLHAGSVIWRMSGNRKHVIISVQVDLYTASLFMLISW